MMEQGFQETLTGRTNRERAALAGVAGWLCDLLASQRGRHGFDTALLTSLEGMQSINGDALQPSLSPHVYVTTLPVIWSLLTSFSFLPPIGEDESIPAMMLNAVLEHLFRAGADSATKRLGTEFVCRLVIVSIVIPAKSPCREVLARWLVSLPRTLWELGNKDRDASRLILKFLLWLGNRNDTLFSTQDRKALCSTLTPYFWLEHPVKGPVAGPWARLEDQDVKRLALEVATVWTRAGDDLHAAVTKATSGSPSDAAYWKRSA
jgi:pre-rRNA-processing protein IPI1